MKKMVFVLVLAVALMMIAIPMVSATGDYDDPVLCVNGTWLVVDAAAPAGIQVSVPDDARYGNQRAGGCKTPAPAALAITKVKEGEADHVMFVTVDGSQASTPTLTVSYGNQVRTKHNTGNKMLFTFLVR
jgi:hypothetical protein